MRAGAYAAHGTIFTAAQLLADISSITGIGIGSSLVVAGADMGTLYGIDKALDKWSPTNQDKAQNEYHSGKGVEGIHNATSGSGFE